MLNSYGIAKAFDYVIQTIGISPPLAQAPLSTHFALYGLWCFGFALLLSKSGVFTRIGNALRLITFSVAVLLLIGTDPSATMLSLSLLVVLAIGPAATLTRALQSSPRGKISAALSLIAMLIIGGLLFHFNETDSPKLQNTNQRCQGIDVKGIDENAIKSDPEFLRSVDRIKTAMASIQDGTCRILIWEQSLGLKVRLTAVQELLRQEQKGDALVVVADRDSSNLALARSFAFNHEFRKRDLISLSNHIQEMRNDDLSIQKIESQLIDFFQIKKEQTSLNNSKTLEFAPFWVLFIGIELVALAFISILLTAPVQAISERIFSIPGVAVVHKALFSLLSLPWWLITGLFWIFLKGRFRSGAGSSGSSSSSSGSVSTGGGSSGGGGASSDF